MTVSDTSRTGLPRQVESAAMRDPGSTRTKPIEFEIDGHHFVAYRRACFILRRDAVQRMRAGTWLMLWAKERADPKWRVYAFNRESLMAALGAQMQTRSFTEGGWYGFTTIPRRLDAHLVALHG